MESFQCASHIQWCCLLRHILVAILFLLLILFLCHVRVLFSFHLTSISSPLSSSSWSWIACAAPVSKLYSSYNVSFQCTLLGGVDGCSGFPGLFCRGIVLPFSSLFRCVRSPCLLRCSWPDPDQASYMGVPSGLREVCCLCPSTLFHSSWRLRWFHRANFVSVRQMEYEFCSFCGLLGNVVSFWGLGIVVVKVFLLVCKQGSQLMNLNCSHTIIRW